MVKLTLTFENAIEARRVLGLIRTNNDIVQGQNARIQGTGTKGQIERFNKRGKVYESFCSYEMEEVDPK